MTPLLIDVPGAALTGWETRPSTGAGPMVILLHAGGENAAVWRPVAHRLVEVHQVGCLAVDQRGHGASTGEATHRPLIDDILHRGSHLIELAGAVQPSAWLVRASRSAIADEEVARLKAAIPSLTVIAIDAGHLVAQEAPIELADTIAAACAWDRGPAA